MKPITPNDIPARFRFILDMYGATDRFVRNFNKLINSNNQLYITGSFKDMIFESLWWSKTPENGRYWDAICNQNEPEIFRLTKELEEKEGRAK